MLSEVQKDYFILIVKMNLNNSILLGNQCIESYSTLIKLSLID